MSANVYRRHFDDIGSAGQGGSDVVEASGSYDCFKHKADNAQNYAWLAGEAYWSKQCNKVFKDPGQGVKNDEDNEDANTDFTPDPTLPPNPVAAPIWLPNNKVPEPQCFGPVEFHQEEAAWAVRLFCGFPPFHDLVIAPRVSFGKGYTSDGRSKVLGVRSPTHIHKGEIDLWLDVSFSEDSCIGMFQFNGDTCAERFGQVLNGCDTAGLFPKHGGQIKEVCAVYRMTARPRMHPDPFTTKSEDRAQAGGFTCEESRVIGVNSPLARTCTCWFASIPTVSEIFDKPSSETCADVAEGMDPKSN